MLRCLFSGGTAPWQPHPAVVEAIRHERDGHHQKAFEILRKAYAEANSTKNNLACLHVLNCYCSFLDRRSHLPQYERYAAVQLILCERVGKSDPLACVMGYTSVGVFCLMAGRHEEGKRVLDTAERALASCHEYVDVLLKRILQGKIHASIEIFHHSPPDNRHHDSIFQLLSRLETEVRLNAMEHATLHLVRAETYIVCLEDEAKATVEREAMFHHLGRTFDPTCPICLCDMEIGAITTLFLGGCFHALHRDCFARMPRIERRPAFTRCPLCRLSVRVHV